MLRQSKFPWPIVVLIVGAALLIAIITLLPRSPLVRKPPAAAQVPTQPTAEQIQLTDIRIVPAPAGVAATSAMQGMQGGGTTTQDLAVSPIKPNEARPVRIYFEHTPKSRNHEVPQLTVTTVTGTAP